MCVMQFVFLPSTARPAQIFIGFNVFFVFGVSYSHTDMPFCIQSVSRQYGICFQRQLPKVCISSKRNISSVSRKFPLTTTDRQNTIIVFCRFLTVLYIWTNGLFGFFLHMCWNITHYVFLVHEIQPSAMVCKNFVPLIGKFTCAYNKWIWPCIV
jgi:hypothetical protein